MKTQGKTGLGLPLGEEQSTPMLLESGHSRNRPKGDVVVVVVMGRMSLWNLGPRSKRQLRLVHHRRQGRGRSSSMNRGRNRNRHDRARPYPGVAASS
ncbi:hypothetical protein ml_197 [Mollivirus sibericum]|uniref:hypothetical protein n=1 Tax=Mollivirus sibericum TaxID=1678078 RepID=UPI0006B2D915|nr:hypothetical protein ml_197 [Mollivirus sibericum]ALD61999.1 hypothetical protein ml_197 [Mollivirus sibericum]